jgi:hypothetical protein
LFLGKLDSLQKALGLDLFDLSGMTKYQEEQRIVAAEFKTIGETVDSLKANLKAYSWLHLAKLREEAEQRGQAN